MAFHPQMLLLPHLMITILLFLLIPCIAQLSFNFTDFSRTGNESIKLSGNASREGSVIQLTPNAVDNWGRAQYSEKMHLWESSTGKVSKFTTKFSFTIYSNGSASYSDGLTFFLSSPDFPTPRPTDGSGIGLVSQAQMGDSSFLDANRFVAVEFDTFRNKNWDPPYPVREHVGIDVNNLASQNTARWDCIIKENITYSSSISYDPITQNLSVTFTGFTSNTAPTTQHLSSIVDLADNLPEWVEFGFSSSTGTISEYHILCLWSFESTAPLFVKKSPQLNKKENKAKAKWVVGLSVGASVFIITFGLIWAIWLIKRKNRSGGGREDIGFDLAMDDEFERSTGGTRKFSYKELVRETNNFAEENKVGEGGFGGVYKGFLRKHNLYVAVKRVSKGSRQGMKEYASEVKSISRLRHRNLVQLIGWCHEKKDLLLIYEFMENGSLDSHLFRGKSLLTWATRYNIAQGLASALLYLHEEWEQCVLHRDIKSSNVMLDSSFNAKLGDFGLARMVNHEKGSQTTALAGTMGYMAPECVVSGKASKESDIYSFGVVALEIACGRKAIKPNAREDEIVLLERVWELYERGQLLDAADPRLGGEFHEEQMERLIVLGLWCAHPDFSLRPSIRKALHVLDSEAPLPADLTPRMAVPAYLARPSRASSSTATASEAQQGTSSSYGSYVGTSQFSTSSAASSTSTAFLHSQGVDQHQGEILESLPMELEQNKETRFGNR